jgi:hypothetical protein
VTIRNTSRYRTEHVRDLVLFAARAMLVATWDLVVLVTAAGVAFKGEFDGRWTVSIGIGPADAFPTGWRAYARGAPRVFQFDWQEGLVATAVHEFAHARQNARWNDILEPDGPSYCEVEAERAARAALVVFRGERRRYS